MKKVEATEAYFIKLGDKGRWEEECIKNKTIRFGYSHLDHTACVENDEVAIKSAYPDDYNQGALTRHIDQVKKFYHAPKTALWITFYLDRLWWCFADENVELLDDGSKVRKTLSGWSDKDIHRELLTKGVLSGKLLAVQSFRGTICNIKEKDYLLHKINGTNEPHVNEAEQALLGLESKLIPIIKNLHPKDFETFIDLIFRQAGWQRTGVAGETEKDIDLDLISPITNERVAVQVKSKANKSTYEAYVSKFEKMAFSKYYFVTHSPDGFLEELAKLGFPDPDEEFQVIVWSVEELARQSVRNGLVGWLIDRAS